MHFLVLFYRKISIQRGLCCWVETSFARGFILKPIKFVMFMVTLCLNFLSWIFSSTINFDWERIWISWFDRRFNLNNGSASLLSWLLKDNIVEMNYFRMYREAISYYEKALALSTRSVSTYAGLAYTYHLQVLKLYSYFSYFVIFSKTQYTMVLCEKQMSCSYVAFLCMSCLGNLDLWLH